MQTSSLSGLKLSAFEWTAILTLFLSIACLLCWCASALFHVADIHLAFSLNNTEIDFWSENGAFKLTNDTVHHASIQNEDMSLPPPPWDMPTSVYGLTLPGIKYRHFTFATSPAAWMLKLSILVPSAVLFVVSIFCFWRYRMVRHSARVRTVNC